MYTIKSDIKIILLNVSTFFVWNKKFGEKKIELNKFPSQLAFSFEVKNFSSKDVAELVNNCTL